MPKTLLVSNGILSKIDEVLEAVRGFAVQPALLKDADKLVKWAVTQKESLSKYRAISLAIEIYNEYGYSNKSKTTIHRFEAKLENVFAALSPTTFEDLSAKDIEEYKKQLEQVCWVYAGAGITHYWYHENQEGLEWIRKANDVIQKYLIPAHKQVTRDCTGIRARLSYYEALLYLQLNDAKRAEEALKSALELADARLTLIASKHENPNDYWGSPEGLRESRYTNMCLAKILGFVKARI